MPEAVSVDWIERVKIDDVKPHDDNYRLGDVDAIADSLKRFGQVRPILVQKSTGKIIAGNHTWKAAKQIGLDEISVIQLDIADDEALAYLIADNRTSDKARNDDDALIAALEKLNDVSHLEGTGYSVDDLEDLQAAIGKFHETAPEPFQGDYAEPPEATAARWEGRDEGQRREVVFLLEHDRFEQFRNNVNVLKSRYDTDSMSDAIFEAVAREAMAS